MLIVIILGIYSRCRPGSRNKETASRQIDRSERHPGDESAMGRIQRIGHRDDCHQSWEVSDVAY